MPSTQQYYSSINCSIAQWETNTRGFATNKGAYDLANGLGMNLAPGSAVMRAWNIVVLQVNQVEEASKTKDKGETKTKLPHQGPAEGDVEDAPPVDAGSQRKHVHGHANDIDPERSKWPEGQDGVHDTQQAWQNGETLPDGTKVWDSGSVIGENGETGVRVHLKNGRIHGYPVDPGRYKIIVNIADLFEGLGNQIVVVGKLLKSEDDNIQECVESGERLAMLSFYAGNKKVSIGVEDELPGVLCTYEKNGIKVSISPDSKISQITFGVAWIRMDDVETQDIYTWFAADPTMYKAYGDIRKQNK